MSTIIEKDYIFEAGIYFEDAYVINVFEMTLQMEVITENMDEQNIAIERMNHFVYNHLQNCVFVHDKDMDAIDKFTNAGMNVCTIYDQPYDQVIASLIMIKINTILENRLNVESIVFGCKLTGGIRFTILYEDLPKNLLSKNWWNVSDCSITDNKNQNNVVTLFDDKWKTLDLSWKQKASKSLDI